MTDDYALPDRTDELVDDAIDVLQTFELTEYEAKCFVAVSRIGEGTAKEVSDVADVPRPRVYDCMDDLYDRGLVNVHEGKPRRFRAVSTEEAVDALERRCRRHLDQLSGILPRLEAPARAAESGDVWTMEGSEEVSERMAHLVADAASEVLLAVAAEDLLTDDLLDSLGDAAAAGVRVSAGSPAAGIRDRLRTALLDAGDGRPENGDDSEATVVETWTWWEEYPVEPGAMTAVLMVDGDALLVSSDLESSLPSVRRHRAVWTDSAEAPIVSVLQPLLARAILGPEA
ncbi:MAG: TrmB family transcriptional regulator [Haloferacaceae archaeon]